MPQLSESGRVLSWASFLEDQAAAQAEATARLPFVVTPLALMPDAHLGKGSTVGSVIATEGAILPAAVGVDIGCGMAAVRTNLTSHDLPENLGPLLGAIRTAVPAGVGKGHDQTRDISALDVVPYTGRQDLTQRQVSTICSQFGTLGSGNHFIELCLDQHDTVWVMLHSGSRGIGNQLAQHHIEIAKGLMRDWFIQLEDPDLSYFPESSPQFHAYLADMLWAQDYALANREVMLAAVLDILQAATRPGIQEQVINCHHNFTAREHHHGRNLWITRKGAIQARAGQWGIIPGSMGTASFIVRGLGSPASFESCSHGAGRRMSRGQARRTLSVQSLTEAMAGRAWDSFHARDLLDEHPASYKPIEQVMADQADLVEPVYTLRQVLNYKGVR